MSPSLLPKVLNYVCAHVHTDILDTKSYAGTMLIELKSQTHPNKEMLELRP